MYKFTSEKSFRTLLWCSDVRVEDRPVVTLGATLGFGVVVDTPVLSHVVRDWAAHEDMNKKALQKDKFKKVQMEDQHLCLCPFADNLEMALFAVFDGHGEKNAAIAAKELFPQVKKEIFVVIIRFCYANFQLA